MSFYKAGIDHLQDNTFRPLSIKWVKGIIKNVWATMGRIYQWQKTQTKAKTKCTKGFEPLPSSPKSTPFTEWLSLKGDRHKEKISQTNNPKLGPILVKSIKNMGPSIDTIGLIGTSRKIKDISKPFSIPYQTMYYNVEWTWYQGVPKWTQIEYSSQTICSLYDEKTGKYQAYAKVKWFTKIDDSSNIIDSLSEWYIRTAWFDGVVNKKEPVFTKSPEKKTETLSFAGWLWPDGREIPAYMIKYEAVKFFKKKLYQR